MPYFGWSGAPQGLIYHPFIYYHSSQLGYPYARNGLYPPPETEEAQDYVAGIGADMEYVMRQLNNLEGGLLMYDIPYRTQWHPDMGLPYLRDGYDVCAPIHHCVYVNHPDFPEWSADRWNAGNRKVYLRDAIDFARARLGEFCTSKQPDICEHVAHFYSQIPLYCDDGVGRFEWVSVPENHEEWQSNSWKTAISSMHIREYLQAIGRPCNGGQQYEAFYRFLLTTRGALLGEELCANYTELTGYDDSIECHCRGAFEAFALYEMPRTRIYHIGDADAFQLYEDWKPPTPGVPFDWHLYCYAAGQEAGFSGLSEGVPYYPAMYFAYDRSSNDFIHEEYVSSPSFGLGLPMIIGVPPCQEGAIPIDVEGQRDKRRIEGCCRIYSFDKEASLTVYERDNLSKIQTIGYVGEYAAAIQSNRRDTQFFVFHTYGQREGEATVYLDGSDGIPEDEVPRILPGVDVIRKCDGGELAIEDYAHSGRDYSDFTPITYKVRQHVSSTLPKSPDAVTGTGTTSPSPSNEFYWSTPNNIRFARGFTYYPPHMGMATSEPMEWWSNWMEFNRACIADTSYIGLWPTGLFSEGYNEWVGHKVPVINWVMWRKPDFTGCVPKHVLEEGDDYGYDLPKVWRKLVEQHLEENPE